VGVGKYDGLFERLCRAPDGPLELTVGEIDALVGGLPASARTKPAWWADDERRAQARAWRKAGRRVVSVDLRAGVVRFSAAEWTRGA
jgi:hypothetical protein